MEALRVLDDAAQDQKFITGLIYYEEPRPVLNDLLKVTNTPLTHLEAEKLRPSKAALDTLMQGYM